MQKVSKSVLFSRCPYTYPEHFLTVLKPLRFWLVFWLWVAPTLFSRCPYTYPEQKKVLKSVLFSRCPYTYPEQKNYQKVFYFHVVPTLILSKKKVNGVPQWNAKEYEL